MTGDRSDKVVRPVRVALTGAAGEFARTFLAHVRSVPPVRPTVLIDLDPGAVRRLLDELDWPAPVTICAGPGDALAAERAGTVAIISDGVSEAGEAFDVLVEATGDVRHGFAAARTCISQGKSVVMVSKEVESVAGPWLSSYAARRGVGYCCAAGDQPANLIDLVTWATGIGMDIVAIGKAGEYDIVWDPDTETANYRGERVRVAAAGSSDARQDPRTALAERATAFHPFVRRTAADLCEMGIVAASLGIGPDVEALHYPICGVDELADVYAEHDDGGIVRHPPSVDVFTQLRAPRESSIAGGVFVVVRNNDARTGDILAAKGHVVSRSRRYLCVFRPYHLMGIETTGSVLAVADRRGRSAPAAARVRPPTHEGRVLMAARAKATLPAGDRFAVRGHHHEIDGLEPVLIPAQAEVAPYYLLDGTRLQREVAAGDLVLLADVADADADLISASQAGWT